MDYEKKYNEALERLRAFHRDYDNISKLVDVKRELESIFPELRESEDERIRQSLIGYLEGSGDVSLIPGIKISDAIAWLEKQKEQKQDNFTHHELNESLKDAVTHQMEDDGDVDEFVRKGIDDIAMKYAELGANWQKEQKPEDFPTTDEEVKEFLATHPNVEVPDKYRTPDFVFSKADFEGRSIVSEDITSVKPADRFKEAREKYQVEWSEEDADILNCCISSIEEAKENRYAYKETDGDTSYDREIDWLKSLRPPQDRCEECPHRGDLFLLTQGIESGKHDLAVKFMSYLDENRPEGKMSLSNGECEDIDKAFKENDWATILRYAEKYSPSWKPSEEQMEALNQAIEDYSETDESESPIREGLESLRFRLKKLM